MAGSEHEDIRGDEFYTSLLLGCRRRGAAPAPPSSAPAETATATAARVPLTAASVSAPSRVYRHARGSPDSGTATSAGESTPSDSPLEHKATDEDEDARDGRRHKRAKLEPAPAVDEDEEEEEEEGGEEESTSARDAGLTPVSVASRSPGSADSSPKNKRQAALAPAPRKTKRRFRKATHTIRKEEKAQLLAEIAQLEKHISELKTRAIDAATAPAESEQRAHDKAMATHVLRDAVQAQQRAFARIQAIMSEYTLCNIRAGSPLQTTIRLRRDERERRRALLELKAKKLADARQFLARRRPSLNPCKPLCEDHRYELPSGDFSSTRFTTIQFEGVASVRRVFDLLVEYFCNIEICISEKLGHITIREDDDGGGVGITQNCLVSMTNSGLPMESNTVLFSEFYAPDAGVGHEQGHGLIVAEFVEEDERHPYRPQERIRRDVSAILELTAYTRAVEAFGKHFPVNPRSQPREVVVVLTRWVYSKLRYPSFPIARAAWEELRDNMDRWGETMHRTLVESLRSSSAAVQ